MSTFAFFQESIMPAVAEKPWIHHIKPLPPERLAGDRIQVGHPLFGIVWINPERLSGAPCFYATRVPVINLFDYLAGGHTLDDFLEGFPGVTREQAVAVLELAEARLLAELPGRRKSF